jgi:hypothetical protein
MMGARCRNEVVEIGMERGTLRLHRRFGARDNLTRVLGSGEGENGEIEKKS